MARRGAKEMLLDVQGGGHEWPLVTIIFGSLSLELGAVGGGLLTMKGAAQLQVSRCSCRSPMQLQDSSAAVGDACAFA